MALFLWWASKARGWAPSCVPAANPATWWRCWAVNVTRIFSLVFALGALTAGLAGVLAAPIRGVEPFMGVEALGIAFVVVVIGGMGSFRGCAGGRAAGRHRAEPDEHVWPEGARLMIYSPWRP